MKVAIYARVSTSDQNTDSQLQDLRAYCEQRKLSVVAEYVDHGISGAAQSRTGLNALMDGAAKRRFKMVIVWRFDRFARSTKHLIDALMTFREQGIEFVSFQENIDTSTPMGKAMFTIISALAELELNTIRERVKAGLRAAKAKGKKLGRPTNRDDATILRLRAEGNSIRGIAKKLGITPRSVQRAIEKSAQKGV